MDDARIQGAAIAALGGLIYVKFIFEMSWVNPSGSISVMAALLFAIAFGLITYFRSPAYAQCIEARAGDAPELKWTYRGAFKAVSLSAVLTAIITFIVLHVICAGFSPSLSEDLLFGSDWRRVWHYSDGHHVLSTISLSFHIYLVTVVHAVWYGWHVATRKQHP